MREVCCIEVSNWPAQCSPLSTVFDLVKLVDEEALRMGGGLRDNPILVIDRYTIHDNPILVIDRYTIHDNPILVIDRYTIHDVV